MSHWDPHLTCPRVRALLDDFLDGSLGGPLGRGLREHVRGCSSCRQIMIRKQQVFTLLGGMEIEAAPPGFSETTLSTVYAQLTQRWTLRRPEAAPVSRRNWLLLPAALLLILMLVTWFRPGLEGGGNLDGLRDVAAGALVEGGREVSGTLDFIESARERTRQTLRPAWTAWQILGKAERLIRESLPPGVIPAILLVGFSPLVILFTLYRFRFKGALNHVLSHPLLS